MERDPHGEKWPYPQTILTYIPGFPVKELPPEASSTGPLSERCFILRALFIQLSKSLVDGSPNGASMESDVCLQSLFYISFRVTSKRALPPGSLHRASTERDTPPPEPLSTISQSPW
jgi:hypothetical protein